MSRSYDGMPYRHSRQNERKILDRKASIYFTFTGSLMTTRIRFFRPMHMTLPTTQNRNLNSGMIKFQNFIRLYWST